MIDNIKTRAEIFAIEIQNGFLSPYQTWNDANSESVRDKAEELFMQGIAIPLNLQSGETNGE